jgi:hypothetical protein
MYNNLDKSPNGQNTIHVFVKEGSFKRGAFENGESELQAESHRELIDIRGKGNIHLIIRSREVPGRNGSEDGLKLHLPEKLKPHHFEIRRISGNLIEIDLHFDKPLPNKDMVTDLDPKVEHPGGGGE